MEFSDTLLAGWPVVGVLGLESIGSFDPDLPAFKGFTFYVVQEKNNGDRFCQLIANKCAPGRVRRVQLSPSLIDSSDLWMQMHGHLDPEHVTNLFNQAIGAAILTSVEVPPEGQTTIIANPEPPIVKRYPATDMGNAERMADVFGDDIRCVTEENKFALWVPENGIWKKNRDPRNLQVRAKQVVRSITPENTILEDPKRDAKWNRTSEGNTRVNAMIASLWNEHRLIAPSDVFDRHLMLLNVRNKTIELNESGRVRDFCREDFITLQAPVVYDAKAKCPLLTAS